MTGEVWRSRAIPALFLEKSLDSKVERARRSVGIDGNDLPSNPVFPRRQLWQRHFHDIAIDLGIFIIHRRSLSVVNLQLAESGLQILGHPDGYLGRRFTNRAPNLRISVIEKGVCIRDAHED